MIQVIIQFFKPNCFKKTEAGGAFFIFHQITDELSTKHEPRLRTTTRYPLIINAYTTIKLK
jgi:hypothetical protein